MVAATGVTRRVTPGANHTSVSQTFNIGEQTMIQPLNTTQFSSAKPRGGLQSVSDLLPRLIELYEMQANARKQIDEDNQRRATITPEKSGQTTFAWYQSQPS